MTNEELNLAKQRAMEYFNKAQYIEAFLSLYKDLNESSNYNKVVNDLKDLGLTYLVNGQFDDLKRWILGFR